MPFIKPQPVPELLPPSNRYNDLRDTFRRVGFDVVKRALQSSNFVTGSAGWRITAEGDFEGSSGTFRGAIAATSGTIAAFTIAATTITATNLTLTSGAANTANITVGTGATAAGLNSANAASDIAIWAGATFANRATAPFRVEADGSLTATDATITGSITATTGTIGGFTIGATTITATNLTLTSGAANTANISVGTGSNLAGLNSANVAGDIAIWAGDTFANRATAPFRVTAAGAVTGSNITVTGGSVVTSILSGLIGLTNLNVANRGWSQTSAFSVTDADTVAWGAGTFTTADGGTAYSIGAGNTGNMAAKTFIYLDTAVSTTAYQTTTTATTAVGAGKVLIAIAQNATGEATYKVLDGQGGENIDAANIVANSITANELSTSITYAGSIIIDTAGLIRSGQTAYDTGTGWFIGNVSGTPKLSIGVGGSTTASLTWDGTTLTVNGYAITGKGNFGGNGADGAFSFSSGTNTVSAASAAIFFKNYTSISLTGTAVMAFSNPHANGTIGIIKSKGAVTLTSSATPIFDGTGMGAGGGARNTADGNGADGTDNADILDSSNHFGEGGDKFVDGASAGAGGPAGVAVVTTADVNRAFPYTTATTYLYRQKVHLQCGSGGGAGGNDGTASSYGGAGGRGGGGFLIECAGAFNFTTASGISVNGGAGEASVNGDSGTPGKGGGGGGGAGHFVLLYNSLTANTGTVTIVGGAGGAGSNSLSGTNYASGGGGGAAGVVSAGGAGGAGGNPNINGTAGTAGGGASGGAAGAAGTSDGSSSGGGGGGGGGGTGTSLIAENLYYA